VISLPQSVACTIAMLVLPEPELDVRFALPAKRRHYVHEVYPMFVSRLEAENQAVTRRSCGRIFRRPLSDGIVANHIHSELPVLDASEGSCPA
jgi:hypothetical protein